MVSYLEIFTREPASGVYVETLYGDQFTIGFQ